PDTAAPIKKKAPHLKRVSVERIRDELQLIFGKPGTPDALKALYKLGIMDAVMPEISGWEDVRGYKLLSRAIKTVEEAEGFLSALRSGGIPWYPDELRAHFGFTSEEGGTFQPGRAAFFKMAAFLHDIGKPLTILRREGRTIFWGHDHEGARVVKDLMLRLRFSRRIAIATANLVKNHHRVFTLAGLKEPSQRAKAHFFNAAGKASGVDLLCLSLVDARATRGKEDEGLLRLVIGMLGFYYQSYAKKRPKPLLNGNEIRMAFGVPEGRTVGAIINKISLGIEAGDIRNKKDAVIYVRRWLRDRDKRAGQ
ncbi:MAG: HD domain-containing protein, partial [Deltaproteobacteria bacterium]|nr:HD domain-containing protein [Deltaproteobacteria bacterium]